MKKKITYILLCISLFFACVHEIANPDERVKSFSYTPSIINLNEGDSAFSAIPVFESKTPTNFELHLIPDANGSITIDKEGRIKIDSSATPNNYIVDVKVNNASGSSIFKEVLTININPVVPKKITFNSDVKAIIQQRCSTCHTTGTGLNYTIYSNCKAMVDEILRRVQLPTSSGDYMPEGRIPLSQEQIDLIKQWKTDGLLEN